MLFGHPFSILHSNNIAQNRLRFSIFIFSIFLVPLLLEAQGVDVRGVVTDSSTAEKLPYADVMLVGTNRGAATNISGFFLITNVPPGEYEITASSIGYEKKSQRIFVGMTGPVIVNFKLMQSAVEMSEVVISETGKRELKEINTSVHILDQKEIRLVPVAVQEDIFRSIQILPGVVSTSDVNAHFYVRGGGGDQNLILLDGMKIYNPFHAFGVFSIFDSDIIKTTEVFTGAFPPGYGGRLSSVVSMTTRDGTAGRVAGRANVNFLSAKLLLEGPVQENFQWLVNGRKSVFERPLSRFLNRNTPLDFYDVFAKITNRSEEATRFSFQGFFSGDDLVSDNPTEPNYMWRTHAVGGTASGLLQDRLFVHVVAFENSFEAKRDPKSSPSVTPSSTSVREIGVKAEATYYTDAQDLYFFGFEFSFPTMEYKLVNSYGISRRLAGTLVGTAMWLRYQTTSGYLKLDGGVHVDVGSAFERGISAEHFQPRLNMSVNLIDGWRAKASYGRFNQNLITVNNEDDVISIFDAWIPVPVNLNSESADHYVLGLEGSLFPALSTNFQSYYKHYGSLVAYNREKVDAQDPDYIDATGKSYGFESLVRFGIPLLDIYAAYTLGWTTINAGGFEYPPRYDRRHTLNLLSVFHIDQRFDVTFRWEVGSGFPFTQTIGYYDRLTLGNVFSTGFIGETGKPYTLLGRKNAARLPAYHRLDASAVYKFSLGALRGSLGLHIINVYNHKNIFYFDRQTGQQVNMLPFFPSMALNLEY